MSQQKQADCALGGVGDWLDDGIRLDPQIAYVIDRLDKETVDFVRQHERGQALLRLRRIFEYRSNVRNFNLYTRRAFQKENVKRVAPASEHIVDVCANRQSLGSASANTSARQLLQISAVATPLSCLQQQKLPSEPTSASAQRSFYTDVVWQLERQLHCRHDEPDLIQPSSEELTRTIYSADMHITKEGRQIVLKRPEVNPHTKRCFRRFGSDRFLFVNVPNEGSSESNFASFTLCKRRFSFLFPKRTLGSWKSMDTRDEQRVSSSCVVAVFFAESGPFLEPMTAHELREWHLPLDLACAKGMSLHKYAERFKLAMSDTDRTIELQPGMIEVRDDFKGCQGRSNTDGNGMISADLMAKIAECLGHPGRRISSVQVRLGPAKGVLVRCDEIRSKVILYGEQVKFGCQSYFEGCEPCQREIEVCNNGVVFADEDHRHPSRLNSQLILVLQAIGCPAHVFLNLEARIRQHIESIMINTATFIQSDFLPSADVAADHGFSDLCFQIHAMHAAGMDHRTDNYLFMCLRRYIIKQLHKAREDGHLPCPDTYSLRMISDFSRRLRPGTMSAYVPGRGFLLGPHLATRIPCGHPGDIILLEAVDDFYISPGFAYENHAVMCADDSLACSPASHMSGGDYDGDKAFVIGYGPIVESVQIVERDLKPGQPDPLMGEYRAVKLVDVVSRSQREKDSVDAAVESALKQTCVQLIQDAALVAKINVMWTSNADRDISHYGCFRRQTELIVQHQELALDSAKTGWRMDLASLESFRMQFHAPRPHWFRPKSSPARDNFIISKSALGQLHDLEAPETWIERALATFKPLGHGNPLLEIAESRIRKLPQDEKELYEMIWTRTNDMYAKDTATIRESSLHIMTYQQAIANARLKWHAEVDEGGYSRDAFALTVYRARKGNPRCWELCFSELCNLHARHVTGKEVISVARGNGVGLHPVVKLPGQRVLGPVSVPIEHAQHAAVLKNLQSLARMHGPPDGGDLANVPRPPPFNLEVDKIRWTHRDPSDHFSNGVPLESLVDDLEAGRVHPLQAPFLVLDVVEFDNCYWSIRNRRLAALRKYQGRLRCKGSTEIVFASVHLLSLTNPAVLLKFLEGFSTETWGESVELRVSSKTRHHGFGKAAHE